MFYIHPGKTLEIYWHYSIDILFRCVSIITDIIFVFGTFSSNFIKFSLAMTLMGRILHEHQLYPLSISYSQNVHVLSAKNHPPSVEYCCQIAFGKTALQSLLPPYFFTEDITFSYYCTINLYNKNLSTEENIRFIIDSGHHHLFKSMYWLETVAIVWYKNFCFTTKSYGLCLQEVYCQSLFQPT